MLASSWSMVKLYPYCRFLWIIYVINMEYLTYQHTASSKSIAKKNSIPQKCVLNLMNVSDQISSSCVKYQILDDFYENYTIRFKLYQISSF